ncbi:MAG: urea ABC transporter ATP-binding protein UrtD [Chloroflexi bacterium]|jgi:urea transport system ATP-binding protein|nr:urea ABC transporter ATP-binding protein UrtD [Chloroflexota bacterium]
MTDYIMDMQNVTVSFDGFKVLDSLSFNIRYGELRFLIGPNGAGKSTLLDIMTGKTRPDHGKVIFDQKLDVTRVTEHQLVKHGIGRKFQTPSVFNSLTVYENLEAALGFKTPVIGLSRKLTPDQHDVIEETLVNTNLMTQRNVAAGILSHGQKQWLEIGMLLVQSPKLLLLDEPVAGMTRRERDHTGELLHRIAEGRSILVVEHDMVFVRQFATTVTVLHMGKLLCEGLVDEVQANERVVEVYLGHRHAA